jgi:hypothetical protein
MIENGRHPLDKRAGIAALASTLAVSADALLGQPAPEIQPGRRTLNLLPLRAVLLDASPDDPPDISARPVAALRALNGEMDACTAPKCWRVPDLRVHGVVYAARNGSTR